MNPIGLNLHALRIAKQSDRDFFKRHEVEIAKALLRSDYRTTKEDGLLICGDLAKIGGIYFHSINSPFRDWDCELREDHNLVTDEGIAYALNVLLFQTGTYTGGVAQLAHWYLTLFNGSTAPSASTTAANFASTLTEITSTTEGFTQTTRPEYVGVTAAAGIVNNLASMAAFTIATATSLTVKGGGLLSSNVRGGTSGKCFSAANFGADRILYNAETFNLGYQLGLSN